LACQWLIMSVTVLSRTDPGDGEELGQLRAYRRLLYTRLQRQLAEAQKNAALRSGARGSQARKELIVFEKKVEEARNR